MTSQCKSTVNTGDCRPICLLICEIRLGLSKFFCYSKHENLLTVNSLWNWALVTWLASLLSHIMTVEVTSPWCWLPVLFGFHLIVWKLKTKNKMLLSFNSINLDLFWFSSQMEDVICFGHQLNFTRETRINFIWICQKKKFFCRNIFFNFFFFIFLQNE